MAQQTFSGVPGDFSAGQVLTAADMDKLREFLLYLIKDGDETDTGEVSPLILDLNDDRVGINTDAPAFALDCVGTGHNYIGILAGTNSSAGLRLRNDARDWDLNITTSDKFAVYDQTASATRLTIDTAGLVTLGGAISLSGDTAAANQLDTYEEGTWTPGYASSNGDMSGGTVNASFTRGTYVRIGQMVWINGFIRTDSIGALGSGYAIISGLPYDSYNVAGYNAYPSHVRTYFAFDADGPDIVTLSNNDNELWLARDGGAGTIDHGILATDLSTAINRNGIAFQLTYITDAAA